LGENPRIQVKVVRTLNPATYLPEEEGEPLYSCEEILDKVFSSWSTSQMLPFPVPTWSSSLMEARAYRREDTRPGMQ
jgi:hypothetical protein